MGSVRSVIIWLCVLAVVVVPLALAATSPLLAWRDAIYIGAGFAGIFGMVLLFVQPLLAVGALPWLAETVGRRIHRFAGSLLVFAVIAHVAGLWVTSPPDVVDALLFRSPTEFSAWGVVAMWAVFCTALFAIFRRNFRIVIWQRFHSAIAVVIVLSTVIHAVLIDGTMEPVSKMILSGLVILATLFAHYKLRAPARSKKAVSVDRP